MAEYNFEDMSSMTTEELFKYLQDQEILATDLEKIKGLLGDTLLRNKS